jgi:hypothetical protein
MSQHVVLLGDSVFDNRAYTGGEPDVVAHLGEMLPPHWRATLCAVDGSTTVDLKAQLQNIPSDATHMVISMGGNDALSNIDVLWQPVASTTEALALFGNRVHLFESSYRKAIDSALSLEHQTTICTIYNGNLDPDEAPLARIALMLFNDVILRVAFEHGLSVIDLRLICDEVVDYANAIEPSGTGGRKIAAAIATSIGAWGEEVQCSRVFSARQHRET